MSPHWYWGPVQPAGIKSAERKARMDLLRSVFRAPARLLYAGVKADSILGEVVTGFSSLLLGAWLSSRGWHPLKTVYPEVYVRLSEIAPTWSLSIPIAIAGAAQLFLLLTKSSMKARMSATFIVQALWLAFIVAFLVRRPFAVTTLTFFGVWLLAAFNYLHLVEKDLQSECDKQK